MSVDIHALSGAYAVDAVDEFERAQFERHLSDCATCRAEVDSLREAGSLIAETSAVAAPDSLRASRARRHPDRPPAPSGHGGRRRGRTVDPPPISGSGRSGCCPDRASVAPARPSWPRR